MKEYLSHTWQDPNTQFDSALGWSPIPNRRINYPNWGLLSSNSHGFRSAEINQNKKQIIILGDSVAWGAGVSDTETFPHYLEEMVSRLGYQVSNLAVSGYDLGQYYLFLKKHINKFKNLKQVILVICTHNDLQCTGRNVCYGKRKPLFVLKNDDLILTNNDIKKYCLRNLFSKSYFLSKFTQHECYIGTLLSQISGDQILGPSESEQISLTLLQKIYELVLNHNAELLVVLRPTRDDFIKKSPSLEWFEHIFHKVKTKSLNYIDYIETLKEEKDLNDLYLDKDVAHFSKNGNLVLAKTVYEYLDMRLKNTP